MAQATATVLGGMFPANGVNSLTQVGHGFNKRTIRQALGRRSMIALREIMETLNGAVAGSTAAKTLSRVEANSEQGGKRTIETEVLVNRATTSGDVTEINRDVLAFSTKTTFGANPPANLDGNPLGTR